MQYRMPNFHNEPRWYNSYSYARAIPTLAQIPRRIYNTARSAFEYAKQHPLSSTYMAKSAYNYTHPPKPKVGSHFSAQRRVLYKAKKRPYKKPVYKKKYRNY